MKSLQKFLKKGYRQEFPKKCLEHSESLEIFILQFLEFLQESLKNFPNKFLENIFSERIASRFFDCWIVLVFVGWFSEPMKSQKMSQWRIFLEICERFFRKYLEKPLEEILKAIIGRFNKIFCKTISDGSTQNFMKKYSDNFDEKSLVKFEWISKWFYGFTNANSRRIPVLFRDECLGWFHKGSQNDLLIEFIKKNLWKIF